MTPMIPALPTLVTTTASRPEMSDVTITDGDGAFFLMMSIVDALPDDGQEAGGEDLDHTTTEVPAEEVETADISDEKVAIIAIDDGQMVPLAVGKAEAPLPMPTENLPKPDVDWRANLIVTQATTRGPQAPLANVSEPIPRDVMATSNPLHSVVTPRPSPLPVPLVGASGVLQTEVAHRSDLPVAKVASQSTQMPVLAAATFTKPSLTNGPEKPADIDALVPVPASSRSPEPLATPAVANTPPQPIATPMIAPIVASPVLQQASVKSGETEASMLAIAAMGDDAFAARAINSPLIQPMSSGGPTTLEPRLVAQQVAVAVISQGGGTTELALNPAELGRVRLTLTAQDTAIVLTIQADRPETSDMMRRHIDVLTQEFRALGYGSIRFEFAGNGDLQSGSQSDDSGAHEQAPMESDEVIDPASDALPAKTPLGRKGGLDLRI